METPLRPMSTSQVLDRTFFLYRNNFVLFIGLGLLTPVLLLITRLFAWAMFGLPVAPNAAASPKEMGEFFARVVIGALISLTFYMVGHAFTTGATMHAVSMFHLGRTTTIKESFDRVKPIWGRLLWLLVRILAICTWPILACYVGMIILVIVAVAAGGSSVGPAVFLLLTALLVAGGLIAGAVWCVRAYCRYALAVPACTIEDLPAKQSLIRSKFLTKDNLGRVFAVYFLTAVISVAIGTLLQMPTYLTPGAFSLRGGLHLSPALVAWTYTAEFLGQLFAAPIGAIAMALVYYDERVRKEAFDLQVMMQAMKPAEAAQVASV